MTAATKQKLSITLAPDLVEQIDAAVARNRGATRSSIIEAWLRHSARNDAGARIREETIAYYEAMSADECEEDEAIARAASRAARRLDIDGA